MTAPRKTRKAKTPPKANRVFEHSTDLGWKEREADGTDDGAAPGVGLLASIRQLGEVAAAAKLRNAALAWELEHAKQTIVTLSRLLARAEEKLFEFELDRLKSEANVGSAA